jgi:short-subunit dehydrogenase
MKHIVITGGASGIGRALAERYTKAGWAVSIVDIAAAAALQQSGALQHALVADLGQPQGYETVLAQLAGLPPVDVFVHSAGINAVGPFLHSDLRRQQRVLDINIRAPLQLTAGLLRRNLLAPGATLVFIASLSIYTSYPGAAVYAASKDGLASYARSLRVALAGQGINVLTVCPGPTRTAHARRYSPDNRREARRMLPEQVARYIERAVQRRQALLIPGVANRLVALIGLIVPSLMEYVMRKTILEQLPQTSAAHS